MSPKAEVKTIAVLGGDGIGPEIIESAVRVLELIGNRFGIGIEFRRLPFGGAAYTESGDPFPGETERACLSSDAVLLGAVGAPEFDALPPEDRPEAGLLRLRKTLGGFANLRPVKAFEALADASPLRPEIYAGTDLVIVRELLGGVYFGEPRSLDETTAVNTFRYSRDEIERVALVAFEQARNRRGKLTSVDKANVLETSRLWRQTVNDFAEEYPDVEVEHMYVDACAMHLITDPSRFDVVLTENLFGDILSDETSVLTGSIGLLPSATVGGKVDLYEPIHGSAPDLAGRDSANPIGAIASGAMMLRYSFGRPDAGDAIENGIQTALDNGWRTDDIAGGGTSVSTSEMTDKVIALIESKTERSTAWGGI